MMSKTKSNKPRVLVLGHGMRQIEDAGGVVLKLDYTDPRAVEAVQDERVHALVLTGGQDIDPSLYGAARHIQTQTPNTRRDLVEVQTLKAAFERGIPILGICRGAQVINAAFGGTLHQHLPDLPDAHRYHNGFDHRVDVKRGSRLRKAVRVESPWVVSLHHQAVDRVAPGFQVTAAAKDGTVEAIEIIDPERWIVGVQFHPEISTTPAMQRLINALVAAAATTAGLPPVKPRTVRKAEAKIIPFKAKAPVQVVIKSDLSIHSWQCFRCGIQFDDRVDHLDHMWFLHDIDLLDRMSDDEINALLSGKE